jgi:hypothetical protein
MKDGLVDFALDWTEAVHATHVVDAVHGGLPVFSFAREAGPIPALELRAPHR